MKQYLLIFLISLNAVPSLSKSREEEFTNIYLNGIWGKNENGEGTSGSGSTLHAAKTYMEFIQNFIQENDIKTVIDAGCGDWEFSQHIDWSNIEYRGYDIVKFVIDKNIEKFTAPNITFKHANFLNENLPPADLFLSKDVFQHLGVNERKNFYPQLKKFKYCLITDGPTVDIYNELSGFNRKIALTYHGDEMKKIVLISNV